MKLKLFILKFLNFFTLVQGLIVGPTLNPEEFPVESNKTLLTKNDFPVLYFPTMETTPSFLFLSKVFKNSTAS